MKRLIGLIVLIAGVWAGYWWVGITGLRSGIAQGLDLAKPHISVTDWRAQGFPSRFDVEISGVELRGQDWQWQIPEAEVMAMAWAPSKLIVWAGVPQTATFYGQDFAISAADMRANIDLGLSTDAPLENLVAVIEAPQMGELRANQARFAVQQIDGAPRYRIGGAITAFNGADINWDARITLPVRLDRTVMVTGIPRPQAIDIASFTVSTLGAELTISGALTVDERGYLDGPVSVEVTNPDALMRALRSQQVLPENQVDLLENMLRAIRSKDGRTVLPVTFTRGQTIVAGLIPVGPAPRLP